MGSHQKVRALHDRLCRVVADHMRRYDSVMINQGFCWGGKEGDHDVLGLRFDRNNNVVEAVSYEIKGRATEVGRDKAFGQARVKQRAMIGLYGEAKLRTFYVTQNYVENIPFSKRRD